MPICYFENNMNISCIKLTASALKKDENLVRHFNVTYLYRDVVFSLNSSRCGDYVDPIYHIELEMKDTSDTAGCHIMSSSTHRGLK